MIKWFIGDISLRKYCQQNGINYKVLTTRASAYRITPIEALTFRKQRGFTKKLKQYGITKDNPDFAMYYDRIRRGWDIEDIINTPKLPKGGNWRNKRDKYKCSPKRGASKES